jgi:hypothetical protein
MSCVLVIREILSWPAVEYRRCRQSISPGPRP